ncbi:cucumber peeling cupredoxin-like isoform X2 [Punica granatum]|uniref:Cucumber peeling cupredoxin-like isoform X2 n=1 Tax=Punica granatum TaxID=22663 RepID=A0A6P8C227_PUNGR|nr:cucumber peeling cupredoxin-like isoform X2 [Punica granatum]
MPAAAAIWRNLAAAATFALLVATAAAYTNHTVGGEPGWFFNATANTSSANFSDWAASQTFGLGDYLNDASDDDTFEYNGGNAAFGERLTIPVPLTHEGLNYFFSDTDDGVQCVNGMRFAVDVKHGAGLPPSLSQPPPPPYTSPPQSPPVTIYNPSANRALRTSASMHQAACVLSLLALVLLF